MENKFQKFLEYIELEQNTHAYIADRLHGDTMSNDRLNDAKFHDGIISMCEKIIFKFKVEFEEELKNES